MIMAAIGWALSAPLFASDVREVDWGMTKEEVMAKEAGAPLINNQVKPEVDQMLGLRYSGAIGDIPATINFYFTGGKLMRVEYEVKTNVFTAGKNYYPTLKNSLVDKYGNPAADAKEMSKDAVFSRLLGWKTVWKTERTTVLLYKKEPEGTVKLTYTSAAYQAPAPPASRPLSKDL
jgi:hypothetical protein